MASTTTEPSGTLDSQDVAGLFPLPLSPFEKYVLWDEKAPHSMTSFIELHFESRLDRKLLEQSLGTAAHRNPLLACRVVERDGDTFWEYDSDYRPQLRDELSDPPLKNGWPCPIDLKVECGSRYWYGERGEGSRVLIQLHHACSDGVGLRRVLLDALTGYAQSQMALGTQSLQDAQGAKESVKSASWEKLDLSLLKERFDFSKSYSGPPAKPLSTWQRLKNAHYFHFQLPKSLLPGSAVENATNIVASAVTSDAKETNGGDLESKNRSEPLRHLVLNRKQSAEITDRCREEGVGVNDVALALLFRTCAQWNRQLGDRNPNSRLRLLMPYDLRSRVDLRMPATNRLSFAFLGRRYRDCDDLRSLVSGVHDEIKSLKETRLQLDFLDALRLGASRPRIMKWLLGKSTNMATAVLTYTGDVSRGMKKYFPEENEARLVGDARLTNIFVAPPIRRNTNVSLGLCINWGQVCISAAFNREVFSGDDCDAFLRLYEAEWSEWLASPRMDSPATTEA